MEMASGVYFMCYESTAQAERQAMLYEIECWVVTCKEPTRK